MRKKNKQSFASGVVEGDVNNKPATLDPAKVENEYMEILLYQSKQRNGLLGRFSKDGKYKIEDETMLQELLLMPKKFDEKVENVVYSSNKIGNHVLNFKIEFDISESYCNAKLFFIEVEHGVEEDVKHVTPLGEVVEPYSPKFKENVYRTWKVYFDENPYDKNDYISEYLRQQDEEMNFNRELSEILSQLYLIRMLKLLENSGELGDKVLVDYKLLMEKFLATDPSLAQNYTRMKQLLDNAMRKHKAYELLMRTQEGRAILAGYSIPLKRVKDKTVPKILENAKDKKKEEKKEEKKKSAPKKAKKKAKAKGGAKIKPFVYDIKKAFGGKTYGGAIKFSKPPAPTKPKTAEPVVKAPEPIVKPVDGMSEEEAVKAYLDAQNAKRKKIQSIVEEEAVVVNPVIVETGKPVIVETKGEREKPIIAETDKPLIVERELKEESLEIK